MSSGIYLGGYPEATVPTAAVYEQDPGTRPDQITDLSQLAVAMRVVLMGPGRLITTDYDATVPHPHAPEELYHPTVITYGANIFAQDITIAALHARLSGGFSLGFGPSPEKYAQVVVDPQSIVALGIGEGRGGYQGGSSRSLLTFTKADLGMEPYTFGDKVLGWSMFYLRHPQPEEPVNRPTFERQPLPPQFAVEHIPGTKLMSDALA